MTPFLLTILIINSFMCISMYNAQYFNCSGDYTLSTRTQSPCYNKIMNCSYDCTILCGYYACHEATINGGNGNVYVNCYGKEACNYIDINAKTANLLRVNAIGYYAIAFGTIKCPQNKHCNITVNGEYVLYRTTINGSIGTKLFITGNGQVVMHSAYIYCPPDYLSGIKYTNNAICDISVNGSYSLTGTKIYANEGF
eukprot:273398_1